jgi:hypothetical protein
MMHGRDNPRGQLDRLLATFKSISPDYFELRRGRGPFAYEALGMCLEFFSNVADFEEIGR